MLNLIDRFSLGGEGKSPAPTALLAALHWNQYVANWPVVLDALRRLWELGKISELKTPYYEPINKAGK